MKRKRESKEGGSPPIYHHTTRAVMEQELMSMEDLPIQTFTEPVIHLILDCLQEWRMLVVSDQTMYQFRARWINMMTGNVLYDHVHRSVVDPQNKQRGISLTRRRRHRSSEPPKRSTILSKRSQASKRRIVERNLQKVMWTDIVPYDPLVSKTITLGFQNFKQSRRSIEQLDRVIQLPNDVVRWLFFLTSFILLIVCWR
jgi:hypothetical protein